MLIFYVYLQTTNMGLLFLLKNLVFKNPEKYFQRQIINQTMSSTPEKYFQRQNINQTMSSTPETNFKPDEHVEINFVL